MGETLKRQNVFVQLTWENKGGGEMQSHSKEKAHFQSLNPRSTFSTWFQKLL